MKNQDGDLKVPLFDLKPSEYQVRCQNRIGSYASTHRTFNLIGSCNRNPNTQSHKDTKIHTLKLSTYELFFQNSSIKESRDFTTEDLTPVSHSWHQMLDLLDSHIQIVSTEPQGSWQIRLLQVWLKQKGMKAAYNLHKTP